ncbi:MAG TPA: hypothetical protein VFR35_05855, partial [Actinoplanes sp.]|nr:hypothetical protein [Actinoplanes sp.]
MSALAFVLVAALLVRGPAARTAVAGLTPATITSLFAVVVSRAGGRSSAELPSCRAAVPGLAASGMALSPCAPP